MVNGSRRKMFKSLSHHAVWSFGICFLFLTGVRHSRNNYVRDLRFHLHTCNILLAGSMMKLNLKKEKSVFKGCLRGGGTLQGTGDLMLTESCARGGLKDENVNVRHFQKKNASLEKKTSFVEQLYFIACLIACEQLFLKRFVFLGEACGNKR